MTQGERLARIEAHLESLPEIREELKALRKEIEADKADLATLKNRGWGAVIDRHRVRVALPKGFQEGVGIVRLQRRDHVQSPTIFGVGLFSSDQNANAFGVEPVANPTPMRLGSPLPDDGQGLRDEGIAIADAFELQAHEIKEVPEPVGGADIWPVVLRKFHPHDEGNCPSSAKMSSADLELVVSPPNGILAFDERRTTTAANAAPARFGLNSAAAGPLVSGDVADDGAELHLEDAPIALAT